MRSWGEYYSGRVANDEHKAVETLDRFTKEFKNKFAPDYVDFGSMGDL